MRMWIVAAAAVGLLSTAGVLGGLFWTGYAGTASAKDPEPTPGIHEACEKMHEDMAGMHGQGDQMHGDEAGGGMGNMHEADADQTDSDGTGPMHQGDLEMHGGMMDSDSHMGNVPDSDTAQVY